MALQSEFDDPLKRWVKSALSTRLLQKGLEKFVDKTIKILQNYFLSDICSFQSLSEAKCTECTTANCLPCPTKDICNVTGRGRNRQCSYHVKNDIKKEYRPCPNGICEPSLREKIQAQHHKKPAWKNTDASKWCTEHWEIAKCYMPHGYGDKISAEETDCSGLLHVIMNCQYVQKYMDRYIATPNGHFMQILNFRNKIFHSASQSLDQEELDCHIDLMIEILQDPSTLAQDQDAQNAVDLLTQIKSGTLIVSSKDESEIRAEQQAAYQARKLALQTSLCEIYDKNFKTIPISPLLDEAEADIDDVVVDMIVWGDEKNKIIKDYKGIFFKNNKACKNIYILGEAGMGKTTWCKKMLRNWVTALKKIKVKADPQTDTLSVDEKVMSEFDIVLFVSLRYAVNDGNIRDMIQSQLFQERPNLNSITSEVLEKEAHKCLVTLDGFDEWSPPENFVNPSTLQNSQTPGRKGLHECQVLTTSRSYKLHQVRLQEQDVDNTAKIQCLKDYEEFVERVIKNKKKDSGKEGQYDHLNYPAFCKEVKRSFKKDIKLSFLRLPLILVFVLCSWLDNGKLETTWAGNFSGVLECMILAAEKDRYAKQKGRLYGLPGLEDFKNECSKYKTCLPQLYLDRRKSCTNYSLLILNLSKLAFYTLFDANIKTKLFFPEELVNKWLSTKEVEVAVKIGILSQIKVVGRTLTRSSSISFLHKTIQEHLAAVHLCSKTDDQQKALQIFKDCCTSAYEIKEYEQILINVYGMNIPIANEVSNHIALFFGTLIEDQFKSFAQEMKEAHDNLSLSSLTPLYVAELFEISNKKLKLKITKTPLNFQKLSVLKMEESVSESCENILEIEKTQTWLPNPWSPSHWRSIPLNQSRWSLCGEYHITLISKLENDDKVKINLSHCKNLEAVSFINMSFCNIDLSQTNLKQISIEKVSNCSIHIDGTAESSDLIQHPSLKKIKLWRTNNCTITLSYAIWKIDNLEIEKCDSCKLVIGTGKLASEQVSEIDQLYLKDESQNIQIEKNDFKLTINRLIFFQYNLQSMRKSFERYLHFFLSNVKVVTITEMPDTEENWKTLKAAIPYLHNMQKFSLSVVKEVYSYDYKEVSYLGKIQSSALHSLQYATKLKWLKMVDPSLTMYKALARALPNMTQLQAIEIVPRIRTLVKKDLYLESRSLASTSAVIESMKWLPFLTDIRIHDDNCATVETLPLVLPHIKKLRTLDLDWLGIRSYSTFDKMILNLMASIQHVESLREIWLTLPYLHETDMCLPHLPLLEILYLEGHFDSGLPEKLLSSISNLPNLRHLHIYGVSKEKVEQLYQVLPILTNLEILFLSFSWDVDFHKCIASLPNTNHTIEVRVKGYFTSFDLKIQDAITESRRFTLKHSQVNTTDKSGSYCLMPIQIQSTKANIELDLLN